MDIEPKGNGFSGRPGSLEPGGRGNPEKGSEKKRSAGAGGFSPSSQPRPGARGSSLLKREGAKKEGVMDGKTGRTPQANNPA